MSDPMDGGLLPVLMFALMFGMGLSLSPADFLRIVQVPAPVWIGTVLQLLVMPLFGFGLALWYELPPLLAVGLVVCGACPGGLGSNLFVHLGRANTALSITLTATATMATLFTLPLWIRVVQAKVIAPGGPVEIPLLATAMELGGLTVLPVVLGMAGRHFWPQAARFERPLTGGAAIGLFAALLSDSLARPDPPRAQFLQSLVPVLWLAATGLVMGFVVPRALGQSVANAVTISAELCVKNVLLGMVVLYGVFGLLEPNVPLLVYSSVMAPPVLLLVFVHRSYEKRRAGALQGARLN